MAEQESTSEALAPLVACLIVIAGFVLYWILPDILEKQSDEGKNPSALKGIKLGQEIYSTRCVTCHGSGGIGGVQNQNYINGTIPALDTLAARNGVKKTVGKQLAASLKSGATLKALEKSFEKTVAVFLQETRRTIRDGRIAKKKDPKGPTPPLQMQAWKDQLKGTEIDALLAYLLTIQKWKP